MKRLLPILLVLGMTGCASLIPKRVEIGQDKVEKFPESKSSEKEIQRQAAQRAAQKTDETLREAIKAEAPLPVILPAKEAAVLTDSVSRSLGPPLNPAPVETTSDKLAQKLDHAIARLNERIDDFKADNDKNAGHKIEGTGFLQIPYFVWLGGAVGIGFIGIIILAVLWTALKAYALTNPPLAMGVNAVQLGAKGATALVGQLIKGGEKFKDKIEEKIEDPKLRESILEMFKDEHQKAQSPEAQKIVDHLTN